MTVVLLVHNTGTDYMLNNLSTIVVVTSYILEHYRKCINRIDNYLYSFNGLSTIVVVTCYSLEHLLGRIEVAITACIK